MFMNSISKMGILIGVFMIVLFLNSIALLIICILKTLQGTMLDDPTLYQ